MYFCVYHGRAVNWLEAFHLLCRAKRQIRVPERCIKGMDSSLAPKLAQFPTIVLSRLFCCSFLEGS